MKRFFKLTLVIGILMIALAISNIVYADDFDILTPGNLNPSESTSTSTTTQTTTQTTTTKTTLDLTTKTTKTTSAKTTSTTLPHTGIEDNTGAIVAIVALAVVGISSFVVIKKNSDI
ncbi:MAG: hypothetical protein BHV99_01690 [Clostridium sp. 26_21]|nr:MAG: hypothetical protein BHV99_01690 [Clostridium sp. 26_21]